MRPVLLVTMILFFFYRDTCAQSRERELLENVLTVCDDLEATCRITDILSRNGLEYKLPVHPPIFGGYRVSSHYGWRTDPLTKKKKFHSGVDLAAALASTVHAAADGKVIYAGRKGGYGKCVIIRHNYGFVTLYAHLSAYYVMEEEEVRTGKVIGFVGTSGRSTGSHLHYEVRKKGKSIKPFIPVRP